MIEFYSGWMSSETRRCLADANRTGAPKAVTPLTRACVFVVELEPYDVGSSGQVGEAIHPLPMATARMSAQEIGSIY
jgi:hypothetical protein